MGKSCDICTKTYNKARHVNKLRGNLNRCGIRKQKPNLQNKKVNGIKMLICSTCIKSMTKIRKERKHKKKNKLSDSTRKTK